MTRLLQAMAGARFGGAEAFFTRLAVALQKAGQEQRVVMRPAPEREAALRRAGIAPLLLPFGGWLDFATRRGFRRAISEYRPRVVLTWMNRYFPLLRLGINQLDQYMSEEDKTKGITSRVLAKRIRRDAYEQVC